MQGKTAEATRLSRFRFDEAFDFDLAERTLDREGVIILENILSREQVDAVRDEVSRIAATLPVWLKAHSTQNGFFFSFSPVTVRKQACDSQIRHIAAVFGQRMFSRLSRAQLGPLWCVDRIILDHKLPSSEPITDWHADQFSDQGRCIKFMLYLADTDAGNGAFSYVPGSHRLIQAISARHGGDNRELHLIEEIRANAASVVASEPHMSEKVRALMAEMESHIASARKSDDHYSVSAPSGSVVVFDANGIHRGGVVKERERLIVRSHCRELRPREVLASPQSVKATAERLLLRVMRPARAADLV